LPRVVGCSFNFAGLSGSPRRGRKGSGRRGGAGDVGRAKWGPALRRSMLGKDRGGRPGTEKWGHIKG